MKKHSVTKARHAGRSLKTSISLAVAGLAFTASGLNAGLLRDIYSGSLATEPDAARYEQLAAEQNVKSQQMRWLPRVSATAREL